MDVTLVVYLQGRCEKHEHVYRMETVFGILCLDKKAPLGLDYVEYDINDVKRIEFVRV